LNGHDAIHAATHRDGYHYVGIGVTRGGKSILEASCICEQKAAANSQN
jgi:hypothetical protein